MLEQIWVCDGQINWEKKLYRWQTNCEEIYMFGKSVKTFTTAANLLNIYKIMLGTDT